MFARVLLGRLCNGPRGAGFLWRGLFWETIAAVEFIVLNMQKILWFVVCAAAGAAQGAAIAWPFGESAHWAEHIVVQGTGSASATLQVLAMAVFFGALRVVGALRCAGAPGRDWARFAAASTFVFAAAWLGVTLWWLWVSLHVYGGLGAGLAAAAVAALVGCLALYYAAMAWVWARWFVRETSAGAVRAALAWAGAWTLAEMARGAWWTGFPWGAVGYAHVDGWLAAWAPWLGVYGVGFLAVVLGALLGDFVAGGLQKRWNGKIGLSFAIVLIFTGLVSFYRPDVDNGRDIPVTLLQANIAQHEKFEQMGVEDALSWYPEQLKNAGAGMVIAPETAVPLLPHQLPAGFWRELGDEIVKNPRRAAILGAPLGSFARGYTNSAIGIIPKPQNSAQISPISPIPRAEERPFGAEVGAVTSGEQNAEQENQPPIISRDITPEFFAWAEKYEIPSEYYQYHKHHLVPFGEFNPPLFGWFMRLLNMPLGDFSRGAVDAPPMVWNHARWAVNICYEDLFGEELVRRFENPHHRPDVLVNISNLAWFGDNAASFQHLNISRMRALEFARPLLRATNTGATAAIDATGRVRAMLAPFTRGVLRTQVQLSEQPPPLTPYTRWVLAAGGLWPLAVLAALALAVARVHCAAFGLLRVRKAEC